MFISPERFIEIYRTADLPLFYIRKGESLGGRIMGKFIKKFDKADADEKQERIEEGVEILDDFFSAHEYGEVNIELMASTQDGKDSRLVHVVEWGEKPPKYGRSSSATVGKPGQPSETWMMMQFMMQQQSHQNQLMIEMLKENTKREREQEHRNYKLMLEKHKLESELDTAPSAQDMLLMETVGLVKPVAAAIVAARNPMLAAGIMSTMDEKVSGMTKTLPSTGAQSDTAAQADAGDASKHCLYNMSMDRVLNCVRHLMVNAFPDYNVNEIMPVMANMVVAQKEMLRPLVIAELEKNRRRAAESAQATNNEAA